VTSPAITPDVEERTEQHTVILPPWRVMLHNDDVHSMEDVVAALLITVPDLTPEEATAIMFEAHFNGVALVIVTPKERAEFYRERLESFGLTSTIEPD
jgi:ATP-dependent Clp protease adaptor protein ClpS